MPIFTKETLQEIAANYAAQAEAAENITGLRRAEGAKLAIEHLIVWAFHDSDAPEPPAEDSPATVEPLSGVEPSEDVGSLK
jgi:hypothetical protein